jgi:hypothetical protein
LGHGCAKDAVVAQEADIAQEVTCAIEQSVTALVSRGFLMSLPRL